MKAITYLKWVLPVILLTLIGAKLVIDNDREVAKSLAGYESHEAATAALEEDPKKAYLLYLKSAEEFADPELKALALYEAANVGWLGGIADYNTLVGLYKQSLRYRPGFFEAAFNLEYLYWLKENAPENLPQPNPGPEPDREEYIPNGDV